MRLIPLLFSPVLGAVLLVMGQPQLVSAQISQGGSPLHWEDNIPVDVQFKNFAPLDLETLAAEDAGTAQFKDAPWRFGIEHAVEWTTDNSGNWTVEGGQAVWRLGVQSDNATSWSFYLSSFQVPKGGELYVYNAQRTQYIGSFTHLNHKDWGGLALSLVEGQGAVLEYRQPVSLTDSPTIVVEQAVQGYRSLLRRQAEIEAENASYGPFGNSGACNINVNCPEGADWQVEKKSVALIVNGGSAACTGALVNNTANDGTPYFLTANHCLGTPNSWTYYFNHESSTCSGSTGPTSQSISGGTLLVADGGSDVALIELSSAPPSNWDVEFVGWDATGASPENATGIHHPSGDVKKICFEENSPYEDATGGAQVWWIDAWEDGVTEPGSSGSPLFDQNHRIIGQLYGGAAACSGTVNNGAYDFYGRFNVSWGLGVSQYLDPQNTGTLVLDGYPTGFDTDNGCTDPSACNYSELAIFDDGSCTINDQCGVCGGDNSSCGGCTNPAACNYDSDAIVDDGSCVLGGVGLDFALLTDNYPGETTWSIADESGNVVLEGGPYSGQQTTYTASTCVATGCYVLTVNDSYGDGLQYNGVVGNYTLTDNDGNVLAQMVNGGNFGGQAVDNFCVDAGGSDIPGCTQVFSCNYNADATVDDGSCILPYDVVYVDGDGDGFGDDAIADWCPPLEAGITLQGGDCDDANAAVHPDAPGTGEGIDNNCDGILSTDEEGPSSCPEDLNQDGSITVADVLAVLAEFGCTTDCSVDVDDNGSVNVSDVLALLAAFGTDC